MQCVLRSWKYDVLCQRRFILERRQVVIVTMETSESCILKWKDRVGGLGDAAVNPGTLSGKSRIVSSRGVTDDGRSNSMSGLSIVNERHQAFVRTVNPDLATQRYATGTSRRRSDRAARARLELYRCGAGNWSSALIYNALSRGGEARDEQQNRASIVPTVSNQLLSDQIDESTHEIPGHL